MSNARDFKLHPCLVVGRLPVFLLAGLLWSSTLCAQSKADLQAQRDALEKKLATTERLLSEAASNKNDALVSLRLIDKRMALREQLIRHHRAEIRSIERSMTSTDSEIRTLEGHIAALKDEYARMIQAAHKQSLAQNPWLYLFSAADFTQASIRFRMLQSYSSLRKEHVAQIESAQVHLSDNRNNLVNEKSSMEIALSDVRNERNALAKDRKKRSEIVQDLKGRESTLRAEVKKSKAEQKRLNASIRKIIESELAAERASSEGEFALTPEGKIVSAAFESNRASLPWPVLRGVITGKFGKQSHPTLPGITFENNGIDISTEKTSSVLAIFAGSVSSVFPIPGAGQTVILSHGAFRTVYSNLEGVQLKKGDRIEAREKIGSVRPNNNQNVLHFEVWKVTGNSQTPQNPSTWLVKL
jgi:septal ring factor EnvC (AmiA/AmiB activator)